MGAIEVTPAHNLHTQLKIYGLLLDNALLSKCTKVHLLGPFNASPLTNLRCSVLGIVPKHDLRDYLTIYH